MLFDKFGNTENTTFELISSHNKEIPMRLSQRSTTHTKNLGKSDRHTLMSL